jgi:hypothetical protein
MAPIKLTPLQQLAYNNNSKQGKYKSKGIYRDGMYFHSMGEADYYQLLKIRLAGGEIKGFKRQVPFKISINGQHICRYDADFVIELFDGSKQVLDFKSEFTRNLALYQIKKKLLLALYNINIIEVGVKARISTSKKNK